MKIKYVAGGVIVLLAAAYAVLTFTAFQDSAVYYLTAQELKAQGEEARDQDVRLAGEVDKSTVQWNADDLMLRFKVVDGNESIPVVYNGVVPDTFELSNSVVLEGRYSGDDVFHADTLLVQCPSKYEAKLAEETSQ